MRYLLLVLLSCFCGAVLAENANCPPAVKCAWEDPYDPMTATCNIMPLTSKYKMTDVIPYPQHEGIHPFRKAQFFNNDGFVTCIYENDGGPDLPVRGNLALDPVDKARWNGNTCEATDPAQCALKTKYETGGFHP